MSDSLDEVVYVRRQHRCRPPTKKPLGATYACTCGTTFQLQRTPFGREWRPLIPADAMIATHNRHAQEDAR